MQRIRSIWGKLTRESKATIVGVLAPLLALTIATRIWMVAIREASSGPVGVFDVFRSDILFLLGFGLGAVCMMEVTRGKPRILATLVTQATALFLALLQLGAFNFFRVTGSVLDFQQVAFALSHLDTVSTVLVSEMPLWLGALIVVAVVIVAALPWVLRRFLSEPAAPMSTRSAIRTGGIGIVFLLAAFLPPISEPNTAFARAPGANLVSTFIASHIEDSSVVGSKPRDTNNARLVPADPAQKNVVFVLLESTRARSTTPWAPELATTPFLAELAGKSLVAERAWAVVPHTSKALVAILCGIEPLLRMPIVEAGPDGIPGTCLAELLAEQSYRTAFFQTATSTFEGRPSLVKNLGYAHFIGGEDVPKDGFERANYFGVEDMAMLEPALNWIAADETKPFFATFLTLTPHHNYLAPRRFGRHEFHEDDELNRYLNTLRYVDGFVAALVEGLKARGRYDNTIFVILGDHGEGFGEHGRRQHDNVIYEEGLHIPLLIFDPSNPKPRRVRHRVSQLDLLPTVVGMLGYDIADAEYPGVDIRHLQHERMLPAHCWYDRTCVASVEGDQKFVHHFGRQPDEWFDLTRDPAEKRNIIGAVSPAKVDKRLAAMRGWIASVNETHTRHHAQAISESVSKTPPTPSVDTDVLVAPGVRLLGYDLERNEAPPGTTVRAALYFHVTEPQPEQMTLHTVGRAPGIKPVGLHHIPVNGLYPVESWEPGDFIRDEIAFVVPGAAKEHFTILVAIAPSRASGVHLVEAFRVKIAAPPP